LDRTPRGRKITPLAQKYLGKERPDSVQEKLF
jgi:hypothetical protein